MAKKSLRFWFYIPGYEWLPTIKSLLFALPIFILWLIGVFNWKTSKINLLAVLLVLGTWLMHTLIHSEYRYSYVVFPFILLTAQIGLEVVYKALIRLSNKLSHF
jgi:thiol:disulfide interchange protein